MKFGIFIIKYLVVFMETLLMAAAVLIAPVAFLIGLHNWVRYGDKMPNVLSDMFDVIRTLFGFCKEIVAVE